MACRYLYNNPGRKKVTDMAGESVDIAIVGAGPAGLAAAAELAAHGASVVVLDEAPIPGGRLPSQIHPAPGRLDGSASQWSDGATRAAELIDAAEQAGARIMCGTSVWGIFSGWYLAVAPTDQRSTANDLPAGFNARAVIIATGAAQKPLVMNGWNLSGVITAGAAQTLINVYHVLPGKNAAVVGLDPLSLAAAQLMSKAGATVHGIVLPPPNGLQTGPVSPAAGIRTLARFSDYAPSRPVALIGKIAGKLSRLAAALYPGSGVEFDGIRLLLRKAALAVHGQNHAEQIEIGGLAADGRITSHQTKKLPVDVVITSAGICPLTDLVQVSGCPLVHIPDLGGWVPVHNQDMQTPLKGLFVAGSITGVEGSEVAEELGRLAGVSAASYLGLVSAPGANEAVKKYQAAVQSARKRSLPFLPDIEKGRSQLSRLTP